MDHADGVAYSVHDFDDFYRAGLIPLEDIHNAFPEEMTAFKEGKEGRELGTDLIERYEDDLKDWFRLFPKTRYHSDHVERAGLRALNAKLIHDFIMEPDIVFDDGTARLDVPSLRQVQMGFFKERGMALRDRQSRSSEPAAWTT